MELTPIVSYYKEEHTPKPGSLTELQKFDEELRKQKGQSILSPYDEGLKRTHLNKLYTNRVYVPWYRMYSGIGDPNEHPRDFQPYEEIQKKDEDIALQFYYGDRYVLYEDSKDPAIKNMRLDTLRMYNLRKRKDALARVVSDVVSFGPSARDKVILNPIVNFFKKLHGNRLRSIKYQKTLKPGSKWALLKQQENIDKIKSIYRQWKKEQAYLKFIRAYHLIVSVQKFISAVNIMAGDTESMFKKDKEYEETAAQLRRLLAGTRRNCKEKSVFDAKNYKITREIGVPAALKLTLTTPWFNRTELEVDAIVKCFQDLKSFVEYPINYQRIIGKVAWIMELPKHKVVIRQGQRAQSFYFVIAGKLRITKLVGNPDHKHYSEFNDIGVIRSQDCFGEECISRPYSMRTYSVVTDEATTLLSVNIHEVYKMEMSMKDNEDAPEHIRFLSTLPFLSGFPKSKLVTEADENIVLFYFRQNTLITTDASQSEFVYVVSWGTCDVLIELQPNAKVIAQYVNAERDRLKQASTVCLAQRPESLARILYQKLSTDDNISKVSKQAKTGLSLESLAPLMIHPLHLKMLQQEIKKTERKLARQKEQFNAEQVRINEKTSNLLAMPPKTKLKNTPAFFEEWKNKKSIISHEEKEVKDFLLDSPEADKEDEENEFSMDDEGSECESLFSEEDGLLFSDETPPLQDEQISLKKESSELPSTVAFKDPSVQAGHIVSAKKKPKSPNAIRKHKKASRIKDKEVKSESRKHEKPRHKIVKKTQHHKNSLILPSLFENGSDISLDETPPLELDRAKSQAFAIMEAEKKSLSPDTKPLTSRLRIAMGKSSQNLLTKASSSTVSKITPVSSRPDLKPPPKIAKKHGPHLKSHKTKTKPAGHKERVEKRTSIFGTEKRISIFGTEKPESPGRKHSNFTTPKGIITKKNHQIRVMKTLKIKEADKDSFHDTADYKSVSETASSTSVRPDTGDQNDNENSSVGSSVQEHLPAITESKAGSFSRNRVAKIVLSKGSASTMPEIKEIKKSNGRYLPGSKASLSRNNSNIMPPVEQSRSGHETLKARSKSKEPLPGSSASSILYAGRKQSSFHSEGKNSAQYMPTTRGNPLLTPKRSYFTFQTSRAHQHSRWRLKKVLSRGDVVGPEWLDYNDRPFDPVQEKWAIVSRGAIVIMIRKTFLLKYLKKVW